jgi:diphthine synthase
MGSLTFVGLGLQSENGMTLEGLDVARKAGGAFAEFYTNRMPGLNLEHLEMLIGKKVHLLDRTQLEEDGGRQLIAAAQKGSVVFFVPGDPMIATTHVSLRITLSKNGIESRIIHAASITSAICGATGLQSYKFGKTITIPQDEPLPQSVPDTISDNSKRGLHTLLLLDINASEANQMTIREAAARMTRARPSLQNALAVGAARIGAIDEKVKAAKMRDLPNTEFGNTPHSIVAIGKLHFMEAEALKVLCGAHDEDLRENS